ncbi:hypothetical protein PPROV_001080100 [Pycnococcus provasolii]|uniref:Fatty acid hydroxylase domain-containing protein n=1 Tax=Pycnococcus provasolii TaxID=41880 RepID=A0A830HYA4_9CHLO|nr:hypothetical protein PPROV_001080100 [Pycnococcus provasolii]
MVSKDEHSKGYTSRAHAAPLIEEKQQALDGSGSFYKSAGVFLSEQPLKARGIAQTKRSGSGSGAGDHLVERAARTHQQNNSMHNINALVDMRLPIVPQLSSLSGTQYRKWVHSPVMTSSSSSSTSSSSNKNIKQQLPKFFTSALLESITQTPWYVVPALWTPIALVTLGSSVSALATNFGVLGPPIAIVSLILGVAVWWVAEYIIHRFAFHVDVSSQLAIKTHFLLHGCHHKFPMDTRRLVFPPLPAAPVVYAFFTAYRAVARVTAAPDAVADACFAGSLLGYVAYDCLHFLMHSRRHGGGSSTATTRNNIASPVSWAHRWLASVRRSHMAHHFHSHDHNFGISNGYVDRVFGTKASDC